MSPYRSAPAAEPERPPRSWAARMWTRFQRKVAVKVRGSFKSRFPAKCDVCGKPAKDTRGPGDTLYIPNTFEPCGHEYTFWRVLKAHADEKNAAEVQRESGVPGGGVVRPK